ncbi:MAG: serine/threonine protein kinase, partial [Tolypothrix sp. Co-bin9]|nr:serine/threonine protein kinase [Tolypothrix sp. Co-bin9]
QLTGTIATINVVGSPKTAQLPQPTTTTPPQKQPEKQPEKVPLLAFFAALLVSLGLLGLVALATRSSKLASLPEDYGQAPERKGKVDYFPYEEGKDSQGRVAEFNVAVLSVEYKWQLGSNYQVKYNNELINLDSLKSNLEEEGIQRIMENPSEIISVGTASCEGNVEIEEKRALERSQQLQLLVKRIFSNTRSVQGYRLLNLGQFQRTDCQANQDSTAYQRSIIIIGVKKQSEGVIVDEALRNRLEKKPFADFKLEDYSLGSENRFKTIPSNL